MKLKSNLVEIFVSYLGFILTYNITYLLCFKFNFGAKFLELVQFLFSFVM